MGMSEAERWLGQPLLDDPARAHELYNNGLRELEKNTIPHGELQWLGQTALTATNVLGREAATDPSYFARLSLVKNAGAAYESLEREGHPTLYPRQWSAYKAGLNFMLDHGPDDVGLGKAGRFEFATGYGKTVLMANLAKALLGERPLQQGLQLLLVVPTHYLADQTKGLHPEEKYRKGFAEHAPGLRVTEMTGRNLDQTGDVVLTTYSFFARHAGRSISPTKYPLVFFDEAHHALGSVTGFGIDRIRDKTAMLAFTATPETNDKRHIKDIFPTLLEKKTIVDGVLKEGFLSGIQIFGVPTTETIHDRRTQAHEYTTAEVSHLISSEERNRRILQTALFSLQETEGGQGLVRCVPGSDQVHARILAKALSELDHPIENRKIRAEAVGAHRADSAKVIQEFGQGAYDVLFGIDIFGEGLDIPELAWAIYAAPTKSRLRLEQFVGRLMRPKERSALFFQLIDDIRHTDERVFAHDLFGIPPQQGVELLPPQKAAAGKNIRPAELRHAAALLDFMHTLPEDFWERMKRTTTKGSSDVVQDVAKIVPTHAELGDNVVSLDDLSIQFSTSPQLMSRIIMQNKYGATVALNSKGAPEYYYPEQAKTYLEYLMPTLEEETVNRFSIAIGVDRQKVLYHIARLELPNAQRYDRTSSSGARMATHIGGEAMRTLAALFEKPEYKPSEGLDAHEISLRQVVQKGGERFSNITYFKDRGFAIELKIVEAGKHAEYVLEREAVEAHIAAYQNAQPLPDDGTYVPFKREGNVLKTLHTAARELGITVHFMSHKSTVGEYVSREDFEFLDEYLEPDKDYVVIGFQDQAEPKTEEQSPMQEQIAPPAIIEPVVERVASEEPAVEPPAEPKITEKQAEPHQKEAEPAVDAQQKEQPKPEANAAFTSIDLLAESLKPILAGNTIRSVMGRLRISPQSRNGESFVTNEEAERIRKAVSSEFKNRSSQLTTPRAAAKRTVPAPPPAPSRRPEAKIHPYLKSKKAVAPRRLSPEEIAAREAAKFVQEFITQLPLVRYDETSYHSSLVGLKELCAQTSQPLISVLRFITQSGLYNPSEIMGRTKNGKIVIDREVRKQISQALHDAPMLPFDWYTEFEAETMFGISRETLISIETQNPESVRSINIGTSKALFNQNFNLPLDKGPRSGEFFFISKAAAHAYAL